MPLDYHITVYTLFAIEIAVLFFLIKSVSKKQDELFVLLGLNIFMLLVAFIYNFHQISAIMFSSMETIKTYSHTDFKELSPNIASAFGYGVRVVVYSLRAILLNVVLYGIVSLIINRKQVEVKELNNQFL